MWFGTLFILTLLLKALIESDAWQSISDKCLPVTFQISSVFYRYIGHRRRSDTYSQGDSSKFDVMFFDISPYPTYINFVHCLCFLFLGHTMANGEGGEKSDHAPFPHRRYPLYMYPIVVLRINLELIFASQNMVTYYILTTNWFWTIFTILFCPVSQRGEVICASITTWG